MYVESFSNLIMVRRSRTAASDLFISIGSETPDAEVSRTFSNSACTFINSSNSTGLVLLWPGIGGRSGQKGRSSIDAPGIRHIGDSEVEMESLIMVFATMPAPIVRYTARTMAKGHLA